MKHNKSNMKRILNGKFSNETARKGIALFTMALLPFAAIAIVLEQGTYAIVRDGPFYTNGVEYICRGWAGCTIPANNTTCVMTNGSMYMQTGTRVGGDGSVSFLACYTTTVTNLVDGGTCQ
jgi:hypothetical protein